VNENPFPVSETQDMKSAITLLAGVVLILGGLALGVSGTLHLVQPSLFEAVTIIRVTPTNGASGYNPLFIKHEIERIQSPAVLTNFIADLNLNDSWGKKYNGGRRMNDADVLRLLKVDCRPIRNTDLIEIRVRSEDPGEAVALANAVARNYRVHALQSKWASVMTISSAATPTRAVSPNRPLAMILIGSAVFMAIGGMFCVKEGVSDSES
jgi:uncharacterized protein involved in exopolysaccharide biosynthesis